MVEIGPVVFEIFDQMWCGRFESPRPPWRYFLLGLDCSQCLGRNRRKRRKRSRSLTGCHTHIFRLRSMCQTRWVAVLCSSVSSFPWLLFYCSDVQWRLSGSFHLSRQPCREVRTWCWLRPVSASPVEALPGSCVVLLTHFGSSRPLDLQVRLRVGSHATGLAARCG